VALGGEGGPSRPTGHQLSRVPNLLDHYSNAEEERMRWMTDVTTTTPPLPPTPTHAVMEKMMNGEINEYRSGLIGVQRDRLVIAWRKNE
jgi:hypothetical protein